MELFELRGIKSPGKVDVYMHGVVELENITDEFAEKLWRDGVPFLALTEKGIKKFYPERKEINVDKIEVTKLGKPKSKKR